MKEQIQERIQQLKAEYESGQKMLADLETQESSSVLPWPHTFPCNFQPLSFWAGFQFAFHV